MKNLISKGEFFDLFRKKPEYKYTSKSTGLKGFKNEKGLIIYKEVISPGTEGYYDTVNVYYIPEHPDQDDITEKALKERKKLHNTKKLKEYHEILGNSLNAKEYPDVKYDVYEIFVYGTGAIQPFYRVYKGDRPDVKKYMFNRGESFSILINSPKTSLKK